MFCSKCGKEIDDEAIVCPACGCATKNYSELEQSKKYDEDFELQKLKSFSNTSIICAILIPIIGLIMSIVGLVKAGQINERMLSNSGTIQYKKYKKLFVLSIILSIFAAFGWCVLLDWLYWTFF